VAADVDLGEETRLLRAELARRGDEVAELRERLAELQEELGETRNDLLESWEQIRLMRKTVSWRVTRPIRAVRRLLR
jgi:hypothetical protein